MSKAKEVMRVAHAAGVLAALVALRKDDDELLRELVQEPEWLEVVKRAAEKNHSYSADLREALQRAGVAP